MNPTDPAGSGIKIKIMEKKVIAKGYTKKNARVSVYEMIEKDEMTCAGIFLVIDGEWVEYGCIETAMTAFRNMTN